MLNSYEEGTLKFADGYIPSSNNDNSKLDCQAVKEENNSERLNWDHDYTVTNIQQDSNTCEETFIILEEDKLNISELNNHGPNMFPQGSVSEKCENPPEEKMNDIVLKEESQDDEKSYCVTSLQTSEKLKDSKEAIDKRLKPPGVNFCVLCGNSFPIFGELEDHFETHCNDVPLECPECADLFEDLNEFLGHMVEHAPKLRETFAKLQSEINETSATVPINNILQQEENKLMNLDIPYGCEQCDQTFDSKSKLEAHIKKHVRGKQYKCTYCNLSFAQFKDLPIHIATHYGEEKPLYPCKECGQTFKYKRSLKKHLTLHNRCKYCGEEYITELNLTEHVKKHEGDNPKPCPICKIPYIKNKDLIAHLEKAHQIYNGQRECELCDKTFTSQIDFQKHTLEHKNEKLFECDICGKVLRHRNSFANHKLIHSGKRHQCAECGQGFVFSSNLKVHMSVHSKDKPHKCSVCNKSFARKTYLNEHMKTHSGKTDICCEYCGKELSAASYYQHKKIHTGERPHKCNICKKTFIQLTHLKSHMRTHTGEAPHKCQICDKAYKRKDVLKRHLLSHQKEKKLSKLAALEKKIAEEESHDSSEEIKIEMVDIEDEQLLYSDINFVKEN